MNKAVLIESLCIIGLILFTNQYSHGAVWGKLHNFSVRPHLTIENTRIKKNTLSFSVFRDERADVYKSFLFRIKLIGENGNIGFEHTQIHFSKLSSTQILNEYVAKVKTGNID